MASEAPAGALESGAVKAVADSVTALAAFSESPKRAAFDANDGLLYSALEILLDISTQDLGGDIETKLSEILHSKLGVLTKLMLGLGHDIECRELAADVLISLFQKNNQACKAVFFGSDHKEVCKQLLGDIKAVLCHAETHGFQIRILDLLCRLGKRAEQPREQALSAFLPPGAKLMHGDTFESDAMSLLRRFNDAQDCSIVSIQPRSYSAFGDQQQSEGWVHFSKRMFDGHAYKFKWDKIEAITISSKPRGKIHELKLLLKEEHADTRGNEVLCAIGDADLAALRQRIFPALSAVQVRDGRADGVTKLQTSYKQGARRVSFQQPEQVEEHAVSKAIGTPPTRSPKPASAPRVGSPADDAFSFEPEATAARATSPASSDIASSAIERKAKQRRSGAITEPELCAAASPAKKKKPSEYGRVQEKLQEQNAARLAQFEAAEAQKLRSAANEREAVFEDDPSGEDKCLNEEVSESESEGGSIDDDESSTYQPTQERGQQKRGAPRATAARAKPAPKAGGSLLKAPRAYDVFAKAMRKSIQKKRAGMDAAQIRRKISEVWASLSKMEKAEWAASGGQKEAPGLFDEEAECVAEMDVKASHDLIDAEPEMASEFDELQEADEPVEELEDQDIEEGQTQPAPLPSAPPAPSESFAKAMREMIEKKRPGADAGQIRRKISEAWASLCEEDRAAWTAPQGRRLESYGGRVDDARENDCSDDDRGDVSDAYGATCRGASVDGPRAEGGIEQFASFSREVFTSLNGAPHAPPALYLGACPTHGVFRLFRSARAHPGEDHEGS